MKKTILPLLVFLASLPSLDAAMESVAVEVTTEPQMPAVLRMQGLADGYGRVVVALSVSAEGALTDTLVLSATHQELVPPAVEAIQEWRFKPARYNGQAVSVAFQLVINFYQTGAVINRTATEMLAVFMERGVRRPDYEVCSPAEMDGPLVALKQVPPKYALAAQQDGVTGRVRVKFYVDENGNVRMPTVSAEAHPYLSVSAVEALKGWKFSPPTRNGQPVLVAAAQEFTFGAMP